MEGWNNSVNLWKHSGKVVQLSRSIWRLNFGHPYKWYFIYCYKIHQITFDFFGSQLRDDNPKICQFVRCRLCGVVPSCKVSFPAIKSIKRISFYKFSRNVILKYSKLNFYPHFCLTEIIEFYER